MKEERSDFAVGLVLFLLAMGIILAVLTYYRGIKMQAMFGRLWTYWSRLTAVVGDALPGVKVIKAFSNEQREIDRFEKRSEETSRVYSYERATAELTPAYEKKFRANKKAWRYFSDQPPGYKRLITHWVTSAKQEETRQRRLTTLIAESAKGRRVGVIAVKKPQK